MVWDPGAHVRAPAGSRGKAPGRGSRGSAPEALGFYALSDALKLSCLRHYLVSCKYISCKQFQQFQKNHKHHCFDTEKHSYTVGWGTSMLNDKTQNQELISQQTFTPFFCFPFSSVFFLFFFHLFSFIFPLSFSFFFLVFFFSRILGQPWPTRLPLLRHP